MIFHNVFAKMWFYDGIGASNLGKYEEAIKYFDKAIKIKPDNYYAFYAWQYKGKALAKSRKYEEAIVCYEKVIEITQNSSLMRKSNEEVHRKIDELSKLRK